MKHFWIMFHIFRILSYDMWKVLEKDLLLSLYLLQHFLFIKINFSFCNKKNVTVYFIQNVSCIFFLFRSFFTVPMCVFNFYEMNECLPNVEKSRFSLIWRYFQCCNILNDGSNLINNTSLTLWTTSMIYQNDV